MGISTQFGKLLPNLKALRIGAGPVLVIITGTTVDVFGAFYKCWEIKQRRPSVR